MVNAEDLKITVHYSIHDEHKPWHWVVSDHNTTFIQGYAISTTEAFAKAQQALVALTTEPPKKTYQDLADAMKYLAANMERHIVFIATDGTLHHVASIEHTTARRHNLP